MTNYQKVLKIKQVLTHRTIQMYMDDIQELNKSLKNLEIEFDNKSEEEIIDFYKYLLNENIENGEKFSYIRYGKQIWLLAFIYENGKQLDRRNKKVREYNRKRFAYNKETKRFVRIVTI